MNETSRRGFDYPESPGDFDLLATVERISFEHASSFSLGAVETTVHASDRRGEVAVRTVAELRETALARRGEIARVEFAFRAGTGDREVVVHVRSQHPGHGAGWVTGDKEAEAIGLSEQLREAVADHRRAKRGRRRRRQRSWWSGHDLAMQVLVSVVGRVIAAGLVALVLVVL